MSLMVDEAGRAKTYAVVDARTQTIVAGCRMVGEAYKTAAALDGVLTVHNVTHSTCPDWLTQLIMADPAYCTARAKEFMANAEQLRRSAATLLEEADRIQAISDFYARSAENHCASRRTP